MAKARVRAERIAGAFWGLLVGDAVGVPYEFRSPDAIGAVVFGATGTHHQPPGTWSDDGALMLATLDALLPEGATVAELDLAAHGRACIAWRHEGRYTPDGDGVFDIGGATSAAIARLRAGTPAEDAGGTGEHDQGNGSLMRILPVGLVPLPDGADRMEWAMRASRVTHGHIVPQVACALYVAIVERLVAGEEPGDAFRQAHDALAARLAGDPAGTAALATIDAWSGRAGRGYVVDAFWSAWDAFAGASSVAGTIERAIAYGSDTDTTAAIAGGLAGARWGIDGIPPAWLAGMRGHAIAGPLLDRLLAQTGLRTSSSDPIRVDRFPAGTGAAAGWTGTLGMTFLPGKRGAGSGGALLRDPWADVRLLRDAYGVETLVLLPEDAELADRGVPTLAAICAAAGISVLRHPIRDLDVPADVEGFRALLAEIEGQLRAGRTVAVACVGGLGRTGTVAACLLRATGLDGAAAIDATRAVRPGTVEMPAQEAFVRAWRPAGG
ncbi:MAG: ADP-ribosylglycohydrolase family protein [Chloroflexota bacterium]